MAAAALVVEGSDSTFEAEFEDDDGFFDEEEFFIEEEVISDEEEVIIEEEEYLDETVEEEIVYDTDEEELILEETVEDEDELILEEMVDEETGSILQSSKTTSKGSKAVLPSSASNDAKSTGNQELSPQPPASTSETKGINQSQARETPKLDQQTVGESGLANSKTTGQDVVSADNDQMVGGTLWENKSKSSTGPSVNKRPSLGTASDTTTSGRTLKDDYDYTAWMYPGYNIDGPKEKSSEMKVDPEDPSENGRADSASASTAISTDWDSWVVPLEQPLPQQATAYVLENSVPHWAPDAVDLPQEEGEDSSSDFSCDTYQSLKNEESQSAQKPPSTASTPGSEASSTWSSAIDFGYEPSARAFDPNLSPKPGSNPEDPLASLDKRRHSVKLHIPPYLSASDPSQRADEESEESSSGSSSVSDSLFPQYNNKEGSGSSDSESTSESGSSSAELEFQEEYDSDDDSVWIPSRSELLLLIFCNSLIAGLLAAAIYFAVRNKQSKEEEDESDNIFFPNGG